MPDQAQIDAGIAKIRALDPSKCPACLAGSCWIHGTQKKAPVVPKKQRSSAKPPPLEPLELSEQEYERYLEEQQMGAAIDVGDSIAADAWDDSMRGQVEERM